MTDYKADLIMQVQTLNNNAYNYFIANQQGDLIFILAQKDNVRQDIFGLIFKGNMLDRATPVRNMIGALAIAKQLDYRQTYEAYKKLNDDTRSNLSFDNFTKLKQVEKAIIEQGQDRVPLLLTSLAETEKAISANEAKQKIYGVIGFIGIVLGQSLLLFANIIAKSKELSQDNK
jgi:cell fate (sporulation/competence/biofilm development) regulator YlbF (YheA/YmcA/DUF963 family)